MRKVVELIKAQLSFFTIIPCRSRLSVVDALSYVDISILTVSPIILTICCLPVFLLSYFKVLKNIELTSVLMYSSLLILTGMLHIDGLTDVVDALFTPREKRHQILKDPHIGAVGGAALFIVLTLGVVAVLSSRNILCSIWKIVLSELYSRLSCSMCARMGRPLHKGLGSIVIEGVSRRRHLIIVPIIVNIIASILILGCLKAIMYLVSTTLISYALIKIPVRALGGVSGDVLGYSIEIGRHISLITLTFIL
ncbi:MAG: adenosylcobinamide-GDP ribazoletransferase [Crenarchaeota archaeon]|nr:adenosylcobinamide-GDP ribazoletransferase [Thermoproteota archaeon]